MNKSGIHLMIIPLFFLLLFYPTIQFAGIIQVHEIGLDDGIDEGKKIDYDEAVLDAKRKACEKAGCKITSEAEMKNSILYEKWVETSSRSYLLPGYDIKDLGYDKDGTYRVSLSGQVKHVDNIPLPKPKKKQNFIESFCKCKNFIYICEDTLWGYDRGSFEHDDLNSFVRIVQSNLFGFQLENIQRITVTGYADGHENRGVKNWSDVIDKCNPERKIGKLFDDDLAKVRGCLFKNELEKVLPKHSILWSDKFVDHPTGFHKKKKDRKVVIKYYLDKGSCK